MFKIGLFSSEECHKLLDGRYVLFLGDSIQRSMYKDLVLLYQRSQYIANEDLKNKAEESCNNDKLVFASERTNGCNYREVREYKTNKVRIRYHYITRIWDDHVKGIVSDLAEEDTKPDLVFASSCLWDISRYAFRPMQTYPENLEKFFAELMEVVDKKKIVWRTGLRISDQAKGGVFDPKYTSKRVTTKDLRIANKRALQVCNYYEIEFCDMAFFFKDQEDKMERDGIHWNPYAHRDMTNILLSFVAEEWAPEIFESVKSDPKYENIIVPTDLSFNDEGQPSPVKGDYADEEEGEDYRQSVFKDQLFSAEDLSASKLPWNIADSFLHSVPDHLQQGGDRSPPLHHHNNHYVDRYVPQHSHRAAPQRPYGGRPQRNQLAAMREQRELRNLVQRRLAEIPYQLKSLFNFDLVT